MPHLKAHRIPKITKRFNEDVPICLFDSHLYNKGQSSTGLNGNFIHYQLLIDCIMRMKPSRNEQQEFIEYFKKPNKIPAEENQVLEEFEESYKRETSIKWYTKETFLYRMLNAALRCQDVRLIYLYRFFIRDLAAELENEKCQSIVHVYRGQYMSKKEFETLKKHLKQYVSFNSFLSTSIAEKKAKKFISEDVNDKEKVLFEIDADPHLNNVNSFQNISTKSAYAEEEILFMIGSIFQILEIRNDKDDIWNVRLKLCANNDEQLKNLFEYMRIELGNGETNLYYFAGVLHDMGKLEDATYYYEEYLKQLPNNHPHIVACYHALGIIASDTKDYQKSLEWYEKMLQTSPQVLKKEDDNTANRYNCMAIAYHGIHNYTKAIQFHEKALTIWQKNHGEEHPDVAMCLDNIGNVYHDQKYYQKALKFHKKALSIREKYLPVGHYDIGVSYNNLGSLYGCLNNNDMALSCYKKSLKIYQKSLPHYHPYVAMAMENIASICETEHKLEEAHKYYREATKIFECNSSSDDSNVIRLQQNIDRVSSKFNDTDFF